MFTIKAGTYSFTFTSLTRSTQMCNMCNNVIIISELIQNEIHFTHLHSIYSAHIHTSHYILTSSSGHENRCKAQAEKKKPSKVWAGLLANRQISGLSNRWHEEIKSSKNLVWSAWNLSRTREGIHKSCQAVQLQDNKLQIH